MGKPEREELSKGQVDGPRSLFAGSMVSDALLDTSNASKHLSSSQKQSRTGQYLVSNTSLICLMFDGQSYLCGVISSAVT